MLESLFCAHHFDTILSHFGQDFDKNHHGGTKNVKNLKEMVRFKFDQITTVVSPQEGGNKMPISWIASLQLDGKKKL